MSDRTTPETDANAGFAVTDRGLNYTRELYVERDNRGPFVHASFARKLERERDELRAEVKRLQSALKEAGFELYGKPKGDA